MFFVFVQLQDRYELAVIPPMVDIKKKKRNTFQPWLNQSKASTE